MVFALSAVYSVSFSEDKPEQKSEEKSEVKPEQRAEYIQALKLYNSRKFKEAVEVLEEHIKKTPSAVDYYLLGYALYELNKFDESNEAFRQAYLLDPEFSLDKAGLLKGVPEARHTKPKKKAVSPKKAAAKKKPEAEKEVAAEKKPVTEKKPAVAVQVPPVQTAVTPGKQALATAPSAPLTQKVPAPKVDSAKPMKPQSFIESFLQFKKEPPFLSIPALVALGVIFGIIILLVGIILLRKRRKKSELPPE